MRYLVEAAEWFVGLCQEGAKTFVGWMGSFVPLVLTLLHRHELAYPPHW